MRVGGVGVLNQVYMQYIRTPCAKGQGNGKGKGPGKGKREKGKRIFIIPVLCLQQRSPENPEYRAERPPFFFVRFQSQIYYTGTLPAEAQSRKPEIQGGALAIFCFLFLESKLVSVLCQNVDQDLVYLWSLLGIRFPCTPEAG